MKVDPVNVKHWAFNYCLWLHMNNSWLVNYLEPPTLNPSHKTGLLIIRCKPNICFNLHDTQESFSCDQHKVRSAQIRIDWTNWHCSWTPWETRELGLVILCKTMWCCVLAPVLLAFPAAQEPNWCPWVKTRYLLGGGKIILSYLQNVTLIKNNNWVEQYDYISLVDFMLWFAFYHVDDAPYFGYSLLASVLRRNDPISM